MEHCNMTDAYLECVATGAGVVEQQQVVLGEAGHVFLTQQTRYGIRHLHRQTQG